MFSSPKKITHQNWWNIFWNYLGIFTYSNKINVNEYKKNKHLFSSSFASELALYPGRGNGMKNQQILMQRAILKASRDIYVIINSPYNSIEDEWRSGCTKKLIFTSFVFVANKHLNFGRKFKILFLHFNGRIIKHAKK